MNFNMINMASASGFNVDYNARPNNYNGNQQLWRSPVVGRPGMGKPSAVFVESNLSINDGYGQNVDLGNMETNDSWYGNVPHSNPNQDIAQIQNESPQYSNFSNFKVDQINTNMEFEYNQASLLMNQFPNGDSNYLHNSNDQNAGTMDMDQGELDGRRSVQSSYSSSSWESFAEDASQTTELSQEEIYEEIQRECAEIERRSTSPSSASELRRRSLKKASRRGTGNRKKELNRVAAAKYREKKRLEKEGKQKELRELDTRNRNLKSQLGSLENEIKYLKGLISEVRKRE
ncbi:hypothetical protein FO519_000231 [Halicephalobus sp. NKZ332]|nr:hypothetical protein FO519_000231 [Halicephalobus sp. NKZ332]